MTSLERLLLSAYREAIRQNDLMVADIVLSAIEACAPSTAEMTESVIEAYTLAWFSERSDVRRRSVSDPRWRWSRRD